ncbi:hypothetical protein NKI09_20630 [Mesorhizobium sp. M0757]|uniref:hypothetical protein n=1 Tax=unclassified Mesorhizobium TaxID=325217 RepID=UPI0033358FBD
MRRIELGGPEALSGTSFRNSTQAVFTTFALLTDVTFSAGVMHVNCEIGMIQIGSIRRLSRQSILSGQSMSI